MTNKVLKVVRTVLKYGSSYYETDSYIGIFTNIKKALCKIA